MRRSRFAALAVVLAALLSACSSDDGTTEGPSFSPSLPASSSVSPSPSPTPISEPVAVKKGSAVVEVSGDVKTKLTLPLGPNGAYQAAPGEFSLSYLDSEGNALIMGGPTPEDTTRTSSQFTVSLVIQEKQPLTFPSARGECAVTVTKSNAKQIGGTYRCRNLKGGAKTINAKGSFSASA